MFGYHYKIILKNTTEFPKVSEISLSREKNNMADDEFVVILNTRAKSDIWTHFGLKKKNVMVQLLTVVLYVIHVTA